MCKTEASPILDCKVTNFQLITEIFLDFFSNFMIFPAQKGLFGGLMSLKKSRQASRLLFSGCSGIILRKESYQCVSDGVHLQIPLRNTRP